ncbi:unnamed protein product [Rotaria sp. Silwood2]|nr:unnamed protein product [Rotaria sp. Silwood2]
MKREFKSPTQPIESKECLGQFSRYLKLILGVQNRKKVYSFITNIEYIKFYYAVKDSNSITFYQSEKLQMMHNLPNESSSSSNNKRKKCIQPTEKCFNEETLKIFLKLLTMKSDFYEYTMLNINPNDYLYGDRYNIKLRYGNGLTSIVYALTKNENTQFKDDKHGYIIKICKEDSYLEYFINEIKILQNLKKLDSNKFNSFFVNIWNSSSTGKFIIFESSLTKLESLTLSQSKELIDIVKYLYDCCADIDGTLR